MSEIYDIFTRHHHSLIDQQWKANHAIDDWSTNLVQEIRDYASAQKRLVDQAYQKQQKHLDDMRDQFVEINNIYEDKKNTEEIKRLLDRCKTLKVELVELNFHPCGKEFIQITPIELSERIDQEELSSSKNGDGKFELKSTQKSTTDSVIDRGLSSNSYSTSTSATPTRMK
jgi:hypothetical protein